MSESEKIKDMENELKALGMEIITNDDVEGEYGIGIEVDLDTEIDYSSLVDEVFVLKKRTKREDFFYVTAKSYDTEKKKLTLLVASPIPKEIFTYYNTAITGLRGPVGTNFPDLCWYHAEGTTPLTKDEVMTEFREGYTMGDLNWYLPSRMVDNFIELMHTLNQSFLEGLMQDTICYGPFLMEDKK